MDIANTAVAVVLALWLAAAAAVLLSRYLAASRTFHHFGPDGLDAFVAMAERYLADDRLMEAMVVASKLAKLAPNEPRAIVLLARVHATRGDTRRASAILSRLLVTSPGCAEATRLLGQMDSYAAARRGRRAKAASLLFMMLPLVFVLVALVVAIVATVIGQSCP
jgi:hypothetical protein